MQTRAGTTVRNEKITWRRGDVRVDLRKYGSSIEEGQVTINSEAAMNEFRRRGRESTGKGAKDL